MRSGRGSNRSRSTWIWFKLKSSRHAGILGLPVAEAGASPSFEPTVNVNTTIDVSIGIVFSLRGGVLPSLLLSEESGVPAIVETICCLR